MCKYKYMHRAHGNKIMINEENSIIPQLNKSSQSTNIMGTMDPEPICWSFSFNAINLIANKQQRMTLLLLGGIMTRWPLAIWFAQSSLVVVLFLCRSTFCCASTAWRTRHKCPSTYTISMTFHVKRNCLLATQYTHTQTYSNCFGWLQPVARTMHSLEKVKWRGELTLCESMCLSVWVDYLLLIENALTLISCILPLPDAFFFVSFDIESMHKCCTLFVFICMCVCVCDIMVRCKCTGANNVHSTSYHCWYY